MPDNSYEVILADEAELDLLEAFIWYEEQQNELGKKFILEFEKSLKKISCAPEYYHFIKKSIRAYCMVKYHTIFCIS